MKSKNIIIAIVLLIGVYCFIGTQIVNADTSSAWPTAPDNVVSPSNVGDTNDLVTKVAKWVISIVGILCVLVIVYTGFYLMFVSAEKEQREKAIKSLVGALIGLAIVLLSFAIVNVIGNTAANIDQPFWGAEGGVEGEQ